MSAVACIDARPHWATPLVHVALGAPEPEGGRAALEAALAVWAGVPGVPALAVVPEPEEASVVLTGGPVPGWLALTETTAGPDRVIVRVQVTLDDDPATWAGGFDPGVVLAHELGHALGLADVDDPGAVMHYMIDAAERSRAVSDGDRAQIEGLDEEQCVGCSTSPGAASTGLAWTIAAVAVIVIVRRVWR